ncbi:hypothetical protein [Mycolicibacterium sp.]|uniref:hypothetical protein n=1 Tax=Mycolicibacterium sp. TaxID=2320850 RepID=UPI0037C88882
MAERSSVETAASLAAAGVGGYQLFRLVQRLRHRATHPDMVDPGKDLVRWLQWVACGLAAAVALVAVALFAWLGPVAIILVVVCVLAAVVAGVVAAGWLWVVAEQRRRACRYVLCEEDYADAPRQIKSTMRRIYRSARSVRSGAAHQQDMFGDLSLDQVVYAAAERAILSSELSAGIRDLRPDAKAADQALIENVNEQIRAIKDELASVEATFKRSARTADNLSERITEPERRRAAEHAKEAAEAAASDRRERARTRLEEVSMRADATLDLSHGDVEDRIDAVAAGYDEAKQVSDQILNDLNGVQAPRADTRNDSATTTRDSVRKAAKFTAGQAAKLSAAVAKASGDKLKNRGDNAPSKP